MGWFSKKGQAETKGYHDAREGKSRGEPNGVFESFIFANNDQHRANMKADEAYNAGYDRGQRDSSRK